jgi:hypothetical protein
MDGPARSKEPLAPQLLDASSVQAPADDGSTVAHGAPPHSWSP